MSLLGKLSLAEASEMEFGLEIYGTTEKTSIIRLVIEGKGFDIACHCTEEKGVIKVDIPKLKGILEPGLYETRLEVVIDEKIFTPLRETIEFNPLVEFDISKKKIAPVKEGVKVKVKSQVVSEDVKLSKRDELINKYVSEGFELSKLNNFDVLKKSDQYWGIVNESNVLLSKSGFNTLSELVDNLAKEQ